MHRLWGLHRFRLLCRFRLLHRFGLLHRLAAGTGVVLRAAVGAENAGRLLCGLLRLWCSRTASAAEQGPVWHGRAAVLAGDKTLDVLKLLLIIPDLSVDLLHLSHEAGKVLFIVGGMQGDIQLAYFAL